jgi:hypothetical protein
MVHAYQRPDAGHLELERGRRSMSGMAGQLNFGKIGGDLVRFSQGAWFKTPGFEINDLGFLQRADEIGISNWIQFRRNKPTKRFRWLRLNLNHWALWNFDGDRRVWGGNVNAHAATSANHTISVGYNIVGQVFDDRMTRGGPGGLYTGWKFLWHSFSTDDRRRVRFSYNLQGGGDKHGSSRFVFGPSVSVRPSSALMVSAGLQFDRNIEDSQWVTRVEGTAAPDALALSRPSYVFGHLHQTTMSATFRVNYTLTPALSLQMYGAPFVSAGHYTGFKELVNGRSGSYSGRFAPFHYDGNPDFNVRSFRTTNVLRWEYRPGSTLFVVWQQGREDSSAYGDFRFRRDFGDVFRSPGHNVILVKLAHWLNF